MKVGRHPREDLRRVRAAREAIGSGVGLNVDANGVRIERMLFDGAVAPVDGTLRPDLSRPGRGLELRRADAERFAV